MSRPSGLVHAKHPGPLAVETICGELSFLVRRFVIHPSPQTTCPWCRAGERNPDAGPAPISAEVYRRDPVRPLSQQLGLFGSEGAAAGAPAPLSSPAALSPRQRGSR
jgi:hypothetical protein